MQEIKILSIDTNKDDLEIIQNFAKSLSLDIESYEDIDLALLAIKKNNYDLVLVNYDMPQINGIEFIKKFRHTNSLIPIIMTSQDDVTLHEKALRMGAYDCLSKPLSAVLFQARVLNALKLSKAERLLSDQTQLLQSNLKVATQSMQEGEHEALHALGKSSGYKEHHCDAHINRIAHYCKLLAELAGLRETMIDTLFHASKVYDIGKLAISESILLKENKLTDDEFDLMKAHTTHGYKMLNRSQSGFLKAAAVISFSHHEKFDGSGYPLGLLGERIPILGRIVAIADVFDALTHKKSYKEAWSVEDACAYLEQEKGKHFDPNFVDLFVKNLDVITTIKESYPDKINEISI